MLCFNLLISICSVSGTEIGNLIVNIRSATTTMSLEETDFLTKMVKISKRTHYIKCNLAVPTSMETWMNSNFYSVPVVGSSSTGSDESHYKSADGTYLFVENPETPLTDAETGHETDSSSETETSSGSVSHLSTIVERLDSSLVCSKTLDQPKVVNEISSQAEADIGFDTVSVQEDIVSSVDVLHVADLVEKPSIVVEPAQPSHVFVQRDKTFNEEIVIPPINVEKPVSIDDADEIFGASSVLSDQFSELIRLLSNFVMAANQFLQSHAVIKGNFN